MERVRRECMSCEGLQGVGGAQRNWFRPKRRIQELVVCEAVSTRSFTCFEHDCLCIGNLPLGPTSNAVENRRRFCTDSFLVCESCCGDFVKDLTLASRLPHRGEVLPSACCDLYSPRMGSLWTVACARGDMTGLIVFAKCQAAIYAQTVPVVQQTLALAKMRLQQQQTLLMSSIMLHGADNLVGTLRPTGLGYELSGNSMVGFQYATPAGVTGASQFNQALGMNFVQGDETMSVAQLEAQWKAVE